MQDVKKKCDKCNSVLKYHNRCDYCGKVIPYDDVFHQYLIVKRTNPEGGETFTFHFCDYEHMTKWMQTRKTAYHEGPNGQKEVSGITPYDWEQESREKFMKIVKP